MKGNVESIINFFTDKHISSVMNIPLLVITLVTLLLAQVLCIWVSKRNSLYIKKKIVKKDNTYILGKEDVV